MTERAGMRLPLGWAPSSDEQRRRLAEHTGGAPCTEFPSGNTPYVEYARMDALLALQHPRTQAPAEPGFIIVSQVKELLFKLLLTEFAAARDLLRADRTGDALRTLGRSAPVQHLLLSCWDVLGTLTPAEFAEFRDVLGSATGFQSFTYRQLEFLLGNKNPAIVAPHRNAPQYEDVLNQLRQPSLYDEALALLARRGLDIPSEVLHGDPTRPYRPHPAVEAAWRAVYRDPARHHDLHQIAEALMEASHLFARWRYTHLLVVQRLLGDKPGSGGSAGVAWLRGISEHRFFPELWSVRSTL
jgi:tryptophan 2,3-dioxygenase